MASLIDIRSRAETPMMAGLIRAVEERSPFYNYLNLRQVDSVSYQMKEQGKYPGASFRDYNATFSTQGTAPLDLINVQMMDFGLSTSTDPILARERMREGGDYIASLRAEVAYSIGLDWKKHILGEGHSSGQPLGVKQWIDFYNTSSNPLLFTTAANGEKLSASGGLQRFLENMGKLIQAVRPNVLVTSRDVIATLYSLSVANAQNNVLGSMFSYQTVVVDGKPEIISNFMGVNLIEAGEDSTGADIIAFDETVGSSNDCATVYGIRFGANDFSVLHRFPGLIDYNEYMQGQQTIIDVHAPFAPVAENTRCVGRVRGIKAE